MHNVNTFVVKDGDTIETEDLSNSLHAIKKYIIIEIRYHIAYLLGYLKILFTLK